MKNIIIQILKKLSKVIFFLTPEDFYKSGLLEKRIDDRMREKLIDTFEFDILNSIRSYNIKSIQIDSLKLALDNAKNFKDKEEFYYLEFGVWKGKSANLFSKYLRKLYVFDSFQGLNEEWEGNMWKGSFDMGGKLPKLNKNVIPIVGFVEDTLDQFLNEHSPKINFVHLDMDLYKPTKFTLEKIKPYLVNGAIILFDEIYNFPN